MKTEKALFNHIQKRCRAKGVGCFKLHCEGQTGWPDLYLAYGGHTILIELKSPTGNGVLSARQIKMIKKLKGLGQEVYVVQSKERAESIITSITQRGTTGRYRPLV